MMVLASKRDQLELEKLDQNSPEMKDTEYKQYATGQQGCSTSRIWLILAVFFLLTSLALGGYLIYVKVFEQSQQTSQEEEIIRKYPGYFRTPEEQAIFEEQYSQISNITSYSPVNNTQVNCTFSCLSYRRKRSSDQSYVDQQLAEMVKVYSTIRAMSKRAATQGEADPYTYHACCMSKRKFISPDSAEDTDGKTVKILKLSNQAQYFLVESCQQADGCTGCRCGQGTSLITAVVKSAEIDGTSSVGIKMIKMPGCCKCHNGVPT